MIRWKLLCATVLFSLLMGNTAVKAGNGPDAAATGSPVAIVNERSFTFSPVPEGTDVVHDFVIKNTGTAPLKIEQVKTG